jgi:hypothetical protein
VKSMAVVLAGVAISVVLAFGVYGVTWLWEFFAVRLLTTII